MYFIEKTGFTFCSKLSLLAPTKDEKMAYAIMVSDEARHLNQVSKFLPENIDEMDFSSNRFLLTLADTLKSASYYSSIFIMQVFLEGYGIDLYSRYLKVTNNENFKNVLKEILADEAFHHGSGKIIFNDAKEFSKEDIEIIVKSSHTSVMCLACGEFVYISKFLMLMKPSLTLEEILKDVGIIEQINERVAYIEAHSKKTHSEIHKVLSENKVFDPINSQTFSALMEM